MKTRTLLLAVAIMIIPVSVSSQVGGLLKKGASKMMNSVGKAVNKEANKEIDSLAIKEGEKVGASAAESVNARSQANQQAEGNEQQSNQGAAPAGKGMNFGGLLGGKVTLKYNDEYKYASRMYMEAEVYDKKEVMKMDYFIYFSVNSPNVGMEVKMVANTEEQGAVPVTSNIIVDGENKCFLMLTDMGTMKMGMISAIPDETATQAAAPTKEPIVTKTGKTRVIAGYKCDEYSYREADKKEYTNIWMTKESNLNIDSKIWQGSGAKSTAAFGYAGFKGMVAMAWETYDEKNVLQMKSEVKEISLNFPYTMSTKGYSLRQMDFSKMQQNQKK
jgi:hypothetical protein